MGTSDNSQGLFGTLTAILKVVTTLLIILITALAGAVLLFYNLWQHERTTRAQAGSGDNAPAEESSETD